MICSSARWEIWLSPAFISTIQARFVAARSSSSGPATSGRSRIFTPLICHSNLANSARARSVVDRARAVVGRNICAEALALGPDAIVDGAGVLVDTLACQRAA